MKKLQHFLALLALLGSVVTSPIYALDQAQNATEITQLESSVNQDQVGPQASSDAAASQEEVAAVEASEDTVSPASQEEATDQPEKVESQEQEVAPSSSQEVKKEEPKKRGKRSLEPGVAAGGSLSLTGVKVTPEKSPADTNTAIRFDATFTVPNGAKGGETGTITLPDSIRYTGDTSFELNDSSGNKVADGRVNGNTITLTYTNYVETHSDISGSLFYYFKMNNVTNKDPEDRKVTFKVDNKTTVDVTVKVGIHPGDASQQFNKVSYSSQVQADGTVLRTYELRIDATKDLPNAVMEDTLKTDGMTYEPDSFEAQKGTWGKPSGTLQLENATTISLAQPTISADKRSFTLNVGDVKKGEGYKIIYKVRIDYTPSQGEIFKNDAVLKSNNAYVSDKANTFDYKSAGGQAEGTVFTVKVHKTDADTNANLAGAVFNVVRKSTGQVVGTITTDASGNASVGNLLRTSYQLVETKAPEGYVLDNTPIEIAPTDFGSDKAVTKEVTNKKEAPKTTSLQVRKDWSDNNNQDGKRPEQVTVYLLKDGTRTGDSKVLNADNNWAASFDDLPLGPEYTVEEETVSGYTLTSSEKDAEGTWVLTNNHTPETTKVEGKKVWSDNNNQDGKRKAIIVRLYADGEPTEQTKEVGTDNEVSFSFEGLAKYKDGKEIAYTVKEENVPAGYTSTVKGTTITNTYTPDTTKVEGKKVWEDNNNQDGKRAAITVRLYADGEKTEQTKEVGVADEVSFSFDGLAKYKDGKEIVYTVKEENVPAGYTSKVDGTTITNTYSPETTKVEGKKVWEDNNNQDGKRKAITVRLYADGEKTDQTKEVGIADEESFVFEGLAKYKDGKEIAYSVKEENTPEGYEATVDGTTITNTHTPETTSITGKKVWDDNNNQDGKRKAITVRLYADGEKTDQTKEVGTTDEESFVFEGLAKYKDGQLITYTVKEENVPEGYNSIVEGTTITNTYSPETTSVSGTKTWFDDNDRDGIRPASIQITLVKTVDGQSSDVETKTVSADEKGIWSYNFSNLPKMENGKTITYSIKEVEVKGYAAQVVKGSFDITNTHEIDTTNIPVVKKWDDKDDQDKKRPEKIKVNLLANGQVVQSLELTAKDDWKGTFLNLPVKEDGKEIAYTVKEENVPAGYTSTVKGTTITNTYTPDTTKVEGKKVWEDNNNQDGKRAAITVRLYADGEKTEQTKEVGVADEISFSFDGLAKYKDGKEIVYTVKEENVPAGYTSKVDGTTITNSYTPETTKVEGKKVWVDGKNQDGKRAAITVRLYADGEKTEQSKEVGTDDESSFVFENLPKYKEGKEIVYTVKEENIPAGYTSKVDGTTITNSYTPEKIAIKVNKVWVDENNKAHKRPDQLKVYLLVNGQKLAGSEQVLSDKNGWSYQYQDLPKYENGQALAYQVREELVAGYQLDFIKENAEGTEFTLQNSLIPELPKEPKKKEEKPGKQLPKTGQETSFLSLFALVSILASALYLLDSKE